MGIACTAQILAISSGVTTVRAQCENAHRGVALGYAGCTVIPDRSKHIPRLLQNSSNYPK